MKKMIKTQCLAFIVMILSSCGDFLETSDNGKLDGLWQLTRIDTLGTGGGLDVTTDRKYLAVQASFLEVRDADMAERYMFRFSYDGDQLVLSDARLNDRSLGDPEVADVAVLTPYGINRLSETFKVEKLTGSRLVLVSSTLRLIYRKF